MTVCHLAGKFAEHLKKALDEDNLGDHVEFTSVNINRIKVAGLCHDLGNNLV